MKHSASRQPSLNVAQARRIALAAQGFGKPHPANVTSATLRRMIGALGAVQVDSVNVLVRSHYLPAFSRLGPYDRALLERVAYGKPRRVFEYWGHEASLLPLALFPLLRWRMERSRHGQGVWRHVARAGRERRDLIERVREAIAQRGPMAASDFGERKTGGSWWGWTETKSAIEFLFWCGDLVPVTRRGSFERVYDLAERVIPRELREHQVPEEEAMRELVTIAARAFGVATESDLRDYFRLPVAGARHAVSQLVESGDLVPVRVEAWKQQAYLDPHARKARSISGSALLSPFDSLVWNRERTKRLFDFHYRIEIYTPAHKRVHGYYVLPYLLGERLVARVDLKADRQAGTLLVHAVHYEPGVERRSARAPLTADLGAMAAWLGLERVKMPR
jgi:uncharacterized protein YcaQ